MRVWTWFCPLLIACHASDAPEVTLDVVWQPEVVLSADVTPGDPLGSKNFTYRWTVDGRERTELTGPEVTGRLLQYGQSWTVEVRAITASGGLTAAGTASMELVAAPTITAVLAPQVPITDEDLHAVVVVSEGFLQTPVYDLRWSVDGEPRDDLTGVTEIPAELTTRDEVWTLTIVPIDPWDANVASASVTIANSPPVLPTVAIGPASIFTDSAASVRAVATDPDGDEVTLTYAWTVDGAPVQEGPWGWLQGAIWFGRDQQLGVLVTATDGALSTSGSATATVLNTPPGSPGIAFDPPHPTEGAALACVVATPAVDPDNDAITYVTTWARNGEAFTALDASGAVPEGVLAAGDRWACTVTASDDVSTGGTSDISALVGWRYDEVAAGGAHTAVVRHDGAVLCHGDDTRGQCSVPAGLGVSVDVAAGVSHTCALSSRGAVTCWGLNDSGQCDAPEGTFSAVEAGAWHNCAIRADDGTVSCWGLDAGQLQAPAESFSDLGLGALHSCGVTTGGELRCWGEGALGQLQVPAGDTWVSVTAGDWHACATDQQGAVACWGWGDAGQTTAPATAFSAVAATEEVSCGVQADRRLACWGTGAWDQSTPPPGAYVAVDGGAAHLCALTAGGFVACWGDATFGQTAGFP